MIQLAHPSLLLLAVPWLVLCLWVLRRQLEAWDWLDNRTSPRGLRKLSLATRRSLKVRMAAVATIGGLLILAIAGPYGIEPADAETDSQAVILLVDASLSMTAPDAVRMSGDEDPVRRIELAADFARDLVAAMPDETAWGLISFSGEAVIHTPPTHDDFAIDTLLNNMTAHYYSQTSGSRFSAAFAAVAHLAHQSAGGVQAVVLSDGELSHEDPYGDSLNALAALKIPVHTVGFGARSLITMSVWVLEDVAAGLEEKRTATEFTTRRESRELERMASTTGGRSLVVEHGEWIEDLVPALLQAPPTRRPTRSMARTDHSRWCVTAASMLFLLLTVGLPDRRRASATLLFAIILLPLNFGCGHPILRADRLNELGLAQLDAGDLQEAAHSFESAAAFNIRAHVPIYNLGITATSSGDLQLAHQSFEHALQLAPRFARAHFNDGHVLYLWGAAELDEDHCRFERTRELWQQALKRFEHAANLTVFGRRARQARSNADFLRHRLAELDELEELCDPPPSEGNASGESGGGGGGSAGGAGGAGGESSGESNTGSPGDGGLTPFSAEDEAQLAAELERIRRESASAGGFRQSRASQLDPEQAAESDGTTIWW